MEEVWKELKGYDGYFVSNLGRIKSPRKILKPYPVTGGYLAVCIKKDGKWVHKKLTRLIAETFIPNPQNKPCIDHINTIRVDNRIENLRWVTHKENAHNEITLCKVLALATAPERLKKLNHTGEHYSEEHRKNIGLGNKGNTNCGWNKRAVVCVETGIVYKSQTDAQKETQIYLSSIGQVCLGRRKTAGGYHWKFV